MCVRGRHGIVTLIPPPLSRPTPKGWDHGVPSPDSPSLCTLGVMLGGSGGCHGEVGAVPSREGV